MSKIKQEKLQWIIDYIEKHGSQDIYEEDFVDSYIQAFNPKVGDFIIPVNHIQVPELGRYLAELYRQGKLWRGTIPLNYTKDGVARYCYRYGIAGKRWNFDKNSWE